MASCFASSVFPTPVGPVNRKHPAGRSGWPRPALDRLIADGDQADRLFLPEHDAAQRLLERAQLVLVGRGRLAVGDVGHARDDPLDLADVDDRRRAGSWLQARGSGGLGPGAAGASD